MSLEAKIMNGFSDIHIAKFNGYGYDTPIRLEGAKSVKATLEFKNERTNNGIHFNSFFGGNGTLSVLGLNPYEYNLLFGSKVEGNRVTIGTDDNCPMVALMFSKNKLDGTKQGYCLYNVKFKPASINATTIEGATAKEDIAEIDFFIESIDNKIYYIDIEDGSFFNSVK